MFDSTIPFGEPELMRASSFRRYLPDGNGGAMAAIVSPGLAALSPSLLADLNRGEAEAQRSEPLDVLAACVRHALPVTVHLQCGDKAVPLTIFPRARRLHCPLPLDVLLTQRQPELQVIHIESALLPATHDTDWQHPRPDAHMLTELRVHPLGPVLWDWALQGSRATLLPEIGGPAMYRVSVGFKMGDVPLADTLLSAVYRLRLESHRLRDIAAWPGFDRERAERLLNALYLQSGLIVSRSHPEVLRESWFGALGR